MRRSALRVALLSSLEAVGAGQPLRRSMVRVGGKPLIQHQAEAALACGCQRVVCLTRAVNAEIAAVQQMVEAAGAAFNTVGFARDLIGIVTAQDEVIALAEGLLVDPAIFQQQIEQGQAVLVQPVETGLAEGFERIDINSASAGALRIPGRLVERIAELPADFDVISSLTRIALQSGVATREVPASARGGVSWKLLREESDATALDQAWIEHRIAQGSGEGRAAGSALARVIVQMFGAALLATRGAASILGAVAVSVLAVGLGIAWLGLPSAGFLACGLAWIALETGNVLIDIDSGGGGAASGRKGIAALGWLVDAGLATLMSWQFAAQYGESWQMSLFAPVMLLLLTRLMPQILEAGWVNWANDRSILALVLLLLGVIGILPGAVCLLALGYVIAAMVLSAQKSRITPV